MRTRVNREIQLMALGGLIAGMITLSQFNLQEVLRVDRFQHSLVSALAFILLYFAFNLKNNKIFLAILGVLAIGFLKEFADPSFEIMDIVANFTGVTIGLMVVFTSQITNIRRYSFHRK